MHVLVAGATGYLGRYICAEYTRRGHHVTALVRNTARAQGLADLLVEAEATRPETLKGTMDGVDLVVSSLGITRQADGLGCREVDYQANLNLLREAEAAGVARFAYVHVLYADTMAGVPLVDAKVAFVDALHASDMAATVIAPTGYFSDMGEILEMVRKGRVWLFRDGAQRLNPIHGADLATAIADATFAHPSRTPPMTFRNAGGLAALTCAATYLVGFALLVTVLAPLGLPRSWPLLVQGHD